MCHSPLLVVLLVNLGVILLRYDAISGVLRVRRFLRFPMTGRHLAVRSLRTHGEKEKGPCESQETDFVGDVRTLACFS